MLQDISSFQVTGHSYSVAFETNSPTEYMVFHEDNLIATFEHLPYTLERRQEVARKAIHSLTRPHTTEPAAQWPLPGRAGEGDGRGRQYHSPTFHVERHSEAADGTQWHIPYMRGPL